VLDTPSTVTTRSPFATATVTTLPVASTFHADGGPRPLPGVADGSGGVPSVPPGTPLDPPVTSAPPPPEPPVDGVSDGPPAEPPDGATAVIGPSDAGAIDPSLEPFEPDEEIVGPFDVDADVMSVDGEAASSPLLVEGPAPTSIVGGVTTSGVTTSCEGVTGAEADVVDAG
jgi:hypothetical protein